MIYLQLFLTFLKIGAFTFGGGYAMLPFIVEEVEKHSWLSKTELLNFVAVSESTPGPFAINIATYIGSKTGGILGGVCATLGVVLPSFVIILIVAGCYEKFKSSRTVSGLMTGLRPTVVGLISSAIITAATAVFGNFTGINTIAGIICSSVIFVTMLAAALKKANPIIIILISAALGLVAGYTVL